MSSRKYKHFLIKCDVTLQAIERAVAYVAGAGILVMMLAGCLEVLARKVLGTPILGVVDLIEASMVAVALLGMAYCQGHAGNVRMTLAVSYLRGRAAYVADLLGYVVAVLFIGAVLVGARTYALNYFDLGGVTPQLGIPQWIVAALVPISLVLLLLRLLLQMVATVRLVLWLDAEPAGLPLIDKQTYSAEVV
jgi:TRAP-type C4-dicarboxylate transport system permease small subunit